MTEIKKNNRNNPLLLMSRTPIHLSQGSRTTICLGAWHPFQVDVLILINAIPVVVATSSPVLSLLTHMALVMNRSSSLSSHLYGPLAGWGLPRASALMGSLLQMVGFDNPGFSPSPTSMQHCIYLWPHGELVIGLGLGTPHFSDSLLYSNVCHYYFLCVQYPKQYILLQYI